MWSTVPSGPDTFLGGPQGQNYFHNNTKISLTLLTVLTFILIVQKAMMCNISGILEQLTVLAPNCTISHYIFHHEVTVAIKKKNT